LVDAKLTLMDVAEQQPGSMTTVRRFILRSNATPQLPVHVVLQGHQTMNALLGKQPAGAVQHRKLARTATAAWQ
jgi:hypothetical protein